MTGFYAPHAPLRRAGRLRGVRRPPPRARDRGDPRLGAGPLPARRLGAGALRRTALYEHADPRRGAHRTGARSSSTTGATRSGTSSSPTRSTGSRSSTPTACASTRVASMLYLDYSARRASGCPTASAAARTSRRSTSSRS